MNIDFVGVMVNHQFVKYVEGDHYMHFIHFYNWTLQLAHISYFQMNTYLSVKISSVVANLIDGIRIV